MSPFVEPLEPLDRALVDFFQGDHAASLGVHSTLGEHDRIPVEVFFRSPESLFPFERAALALCRGRVLDFGACAGVHSLLLQERGLEVLAVETLPGAVEILRARGVERVVRGDAFELDEGPFETVLMMMNGIGPVGTLEGLDRFLARAPALLAPGGQILVDSAPPVRHDDDPGREDVDLPTEEPSYPGEAWIRLEYDGELGPAFRELYVEEDVLAERAGAGGWACSFVHRDEEGSYVAQLLWPGED